MIEQLGSWQEPMTDRIALSLLHFVWQGTLVALVLAVVLPILRDRGAQSSARLANLRYLCAASALALMSLLPVVNFAWMHFSDSDARFSRLDIVRASAPAGGAPATRLASERIRDLERESGGANSAPAAGVEAPVSDVAWTSSLQMLALKVCFWAWLSGVVVHAIWHLIGWSLAQKLRLLGEPPRHVIERVQVLAKRLQVCCQIQVRQTLRSTSPFVIGAFRPVLVVPTAIVAGLNPSELEAILAHELAHIKRRDYLVNLLQVSIETLLFYHPAVWWVSRQVRNEREFCADDLATQVCGGRDVYVRSLVSLAELTSVAAPAVAATGGRLTRRVKRLLQLEDPANLRSFRPAAMAVVLTLLAVGLMVSTAALERARADESTPQRVVTDGTDSKASKAVVGDEVTDSLEIFLAEKEPAEGLREHAIAGGDRKVYLGKDPVLTGADIASARVSTSAAGDPAIAVTFDRRGQEKIAAATRKHRGKRLAIVLNGRVVSAPIVQGAVLKTAVITGRFTQAEAQQLAAALDPSKESEPPTKEGPDKDTESKDQSPLAKAIRAVNLEAAKHPVAKQSQPLREAEVLEAIGKLEPSSNLSAEECTSLKQIAKAGDLPDKTSLRQFFRYDDGESMQHGRWVRLLLEREGRGPFSTTIRGDLTFTRPYTQKERQFRASVRGGGIPTLNRLVTYFKKDPRFGSTPKATADYAPLVDSTKGAIEQHDAEALLKLFHLAGVKNKSAIKTFLRGEIKKAVGRPLKSVQFRPKRFTGELYQWQGFMIYGPNLPVEGYLRIVFADQRPKQPAVLQLEVGALNGEPRLVCHVLKEDRLKERIGKKIGRVVVSGFTFPLSDKAVEIAAKIEAPESMPELLQANKEIWKIRLD